MSEDPKATIHVAGGFCLSCQSHFVEVSFGHSKFEKHGFTEREAKEKFEAARDILKAADGRSMADKLNEVFELLGIRGVRAGEAAPSPFGKPRFG